jgi:hypothetical protein
MPPCPGISYPVAGPAGHGDVHLRLLTAAVPVPTVLPGSTFIPIARALKRFAVRPDGRFLHQRVDQNAAGTRANQPPLVLSSHRIDVALAEVTNVVRVLQVLNLRRIASVLADKQTDGALVLFAAIDQHLFAIALAFECDARQLHQHRNRNARRQHEDEQQRETGFALSPPGCVRPTHEFTCSGSSGSVCWFLLDVSSTTAEFTPMRTTLYRFLISSPSPATKMSSPSMKKARLCPASEDW